MKGKNEETAISILTAMAVHSLWEARDKGGVSPANLSAHTAILTKILFKTKFSSQARIIQNIST